MALSQNFLIAQKFTGAAEGGLTDDKHDRGGITNFGVCIVFLSDIANGSAANREKLASLGIKTPISRQTIIDLTKTQAEELFKWQFWDRLRLDELPLRMGVLIYDAAVNHGRVWGVKLAQRGYNRIVPESEQLQVDGKIGPKTINALASHDTPECHDAILEARRNYYDAIIRNDPKQKRFEHGWYNRISNLSNYIRSLK